MQEEGITENWELPTQNYGCYLKANREYFRIPKEQIIKGLCAKSLLNNFEAGKKGAGWILEERLLRRGQVADDACEKYLDDEDHADWEEREKILDFLEEGKREAMKEALEKYADRHGFERVEIKSGKQSMTNAGTNTLQNHPARRQDAYTTAGDVIKRLKRQFYLGMSGIYQKLAGTAPEELTEIFDAAVRQSVPDIGKKPLQNFVLCAEEINLILEYAQTLPANDTRRWCRELKAYLENRRTDDDIRVLNYPKTILVLCQVLRKEDAEGIRTCPEVLKLCDLAIDLLQKTKKAYYLLEILKMKKSTLEHMQEFHISNGEPQKAGALKGMLAAAEYWLEHIGGLYEHFGVKRGQNSDAYLYRGQDVFHAAEMIRSRRIMLGITQKQLQEGLTCTLETVQNLERKKHSTQPFNLQQMCKKLGLPTANARTELIAENKEVYVLEKEIRYAMNDGKYKENLEQIGKLKELIDMSEPINKQWVLRTEGMAGHELGQIGEEEYEETVKQALECTLPLSILEYPDKKPCYLTNSEMESIYHYSLLVLHKDAQEAYRRMNLVFRVEREFEETGNAKRHVRTYELYMEYKAALLNEMGEYERAKQYAEKVIQLCLRAGRTNALDRALYTWMRSNAKIQEKETEPKKTSYQWRKDLECCIALSRFCKNSIEEQFYKEVLENVKTNVASEDEG